MITKLGVWVDDPANMTTEQKQAYDEQIHHPSQKQINSRGMTDEMHDLMLSPSHKHRQRRK
tara:strand:+ start:394 stop:576 length:183 start_codon:yes stop_codon:yes gene_type:complete